MRRLCVFLASGALLLGVAGSASAGTFTSGTIGLSIGALPPITLGDNGVPFTITAGGVMTEPAFEFGPATIPLPRGLFTGVPSISGLTLAGFGNGSKVEIEHVVEYGLVAGDRWLWYSIGTKKVEEGVEHGLFARELASGRTVRLLAGYGDA